MKSFTLIIQGAPYTSQCSGTALRFARELLAQGHSIYRLFFYQDGVYNASSQIVPPQDEQHLPHAWQALVQANNIDAVICIASALKRGILDATEASRYDVGAGNVLEGFTISGLGQLVDGCIHADRVVTFAP